jgi:1-deoxy-D-xylulose-5-phosphate reductoisomerase
MQKLAILGSTGSIGQSALDLVDLYPEEFKVVALAANQNSELLFEQAEKYRPDLVVLHNQEAATTLKQQLPGIRVGSGTEGLVEVSCHPDATVVLSSIMGAAGLQPTYYAILQGRRVALANKESLVTAGALLVDLARRQGSVLLPVDSEHSALHQCLRGAESSHVQRLLLTASGGPFLNLPYERMADVTVAQALEHPTWDMGPKITIDSATLMNKGLEVIEAHHLFATPPDRISVAVHPQSVVHSIVEFIDGTMLAQLSITDMRTSLLYAFSYPDRWESRLPHVDLFSLPPLRFEAPDTKRFPCLNLAFHALQVGGSFPTALNAANEVAVGLFLDGRIPFLGIPTLIEETLARHTRVDIESLEVVLETDKQARKITESLAMGRGWS